MTTCSDFASGPSIEELCKEFAAWVPIEKELPKCYQINGFWTSVPVIVALEDGRVCGAFFSFVGGDAMDEGTPQEPVPTFETDEGLAYTKPTHWKPVGLHPSLLQAKIDAALQR
ncbi:MAG: hypothetical protein WC869_00035 [Phycisphaerae bacterium]|jgi:hypothetical protein